MGNECQVCERCGKADDVEVMHMYADYWVHTGPCREDTADDYDDSIDPWLAFE